MSVCTLYFTLLFHRFSTLQQHLRLFQRKEICFSAVPSGQPAVRALSSISTYHSVYKECLKDPCRRVRAESARQGKKLAGHSHPNQSDKTIYARIALLVYDRIQGRSAMMKDAPEETTYPIVDRRHVHQEELLYNRTHFILLERILTNQANLVLIRSTDYRGYL